MKNFNELKVGDVVFDRNGNQMIIRMIRDKNSITCQEFDYDDDDFTGVECANLTIHDLF